MEIELRGFQNPFKKQRQSDTAPEKAFEPQFFRKIVIFNDLWIPKRNQNRRKNAENAMLKNNTFFIGIFFALASENGRKIHCFLDLYRES